MSKTTRLPQRIRWLLPLLLLLTACAGGDIILNLDVYSFLEPEDLEEDYQATVPATGIWLPLVGIIPPREINLIDGLGGATVPAEGVLQVEGEFENRSGVASARVEVHLAASSADAVASLSPVLRIPVDLQDGVTSSFAESVDLDQDTLQLFTGNSIWVRLDAWVMIPAGPLTVDMDGTARLTGLRIRILTNEDLIRGQ